ncbi:BON domain-containing protein [Cupriavidus sp. UGS-1]|uniref:BON domain-containing protein n=1 Tax=Cupriavidus sp. UGS-1 TaxID=2899826 RepID=UPI001E5D0C10|nr:BON domain-containing protein [Cupriavidus sp. UGS-1]MCD9122672.1 BON domain-containing protein [Cupriavidus sp. UGS-1]
MRNESMRRNRPDQSWPGYDQRDDGWSDNRSERWAQDDWQAESEGNEWESRWRRAQMTPYQLSEGGPPRGAFDDDDTYGTGYGREAGRQSQPYRGGGSGGYGEGRYSGEQYTSGQSGRGQYGRAQGGGQGGGGGQYGRGYGRGGYGGSQSGYGSEYGSEYGGRYGGRYGGEYGGEYGSQYGRQYGGQSGSEYGGQYGGQYGGESGSSSGYGRGESSTRRNEYRTDPWQSGYSGAAALETGTGPSYATGTRGDEWSDEDERYGGTSGTTTWRGGQRQGMRNRDQDWLREAERSGGYSNAGTSNYGWDRFDDDWPGRNYAVPEHRYGGDYREEWSGRDAGRLSAGELSYGGGYGGEYRGGYRGDYGRDERRERDDDRDEHGPLYNIGRRIGEAVSEFFGTDDRPQRRVGPKGYRRSDERVREAVCERLAYAEGLDVSEVTVDVDGGIVKLGGTVRDRNEKYDIEDLVDNVFGVTDVENDIRVRRDSGESPAKMDDLKGWTPD